MKRPFGALPISEAPKDGSFFIAIAETREGIKSPYCCTVGSFKSYEDDNPKLNEIA